MTPIIIIAGIGGSGPEHWQSLWAQADPHARVFLPPCWDQPDLEDWIGALDSIVAAAPAAPVLVAHSLGCLLVAHWNSRSAHVIRGAFLVAVPDSGGPMFPAAAAPFDPTPDRRLGFPSLIVSSSSDPYGSADYARMRARQWGSDIVSVGPCGHINGASGLGDWPEGQRLLSTFLDAIEG